MPLTQLERLRQMCASYTRHARALSKMPPATLGRVAASNDSARVWLDQRETTTADRDGE